ncbi:unnamed protein product [Danaus chrysippus]|uniref:(African queen) hypothetical protein n=1 Tax=Danaus chrysippus TaxID=151541 RepID=A0A8J2W3Z3_9NEOP|nr:unnamed protein product [Danaus chrysippus]
MYGSGTIPELIAGVGSARARWKIEFQCHNSADVKMIGGLRKIVCWCARRGVRGVRGEGCARAAGWRRRRRQCPGPNARRARACSSLELARDRVVPQCFMWNTKSARGVPPAQLRK